MKTIRMMLSLALAGGIFSSASLFAVDSTQPNPFKKALSSVPVLDLPVKAASLVKQAREEDRASTTMAVVQAASELKPASVPVVISAIAKTTPSQAAVAAATAAEGQPDLAAAVVRAAAGAAPGQVSQIVSAVCRKTPAQYQAIAISAAEAVPTAGADILSGVSAAIPELAPAIQQAAADDKASGISAIPGGKAGPLAFAGKPKSAYVPGVLVRVKSFTSVTPIVGAPFQPLPGVPGEITVPQTHPVPPGGRNYARP